MTQSESQVSKDFSIGFGSVIRCIADKTDQCNQCPECSTGQYQPCEHCLVCVHSRLVAVRIPSDGA